MYSLYYCTVLYSTVLKFPVLYSTLNKPIIESNATDWAFDCKPAPGYNFYTPGFETPMPLV